MKYCTKCGKLYNDDDVACNDCKKGLLETITDESTPVLLCSGDVMERDRVQAALKDSGIPSVFKRKMVTGNSQLVTGVDLDLFDILVPFNQYEKAFDIAVGIGAIQLEDCEIIQEEPVDEAVEEFEKMSPSKRTLVRIISALLFILVAAGIIFGVDFIMAFIKSLFM